METRANVFDLARDVSEHVRFVSLAHIYIVVARFLTRMIATEFVVFNKHSFQDDQKLINKR